MVLGFTAENSLSISVVPKIKLSKELSRDPRALDKLSMDRTTASYKLRYGLAKTINEETLETTKSNFFSLNLNESTSNNRKRVLRILASYYSPLENKIVMQHLTAISLVKVDVDSIYKDITNYFQNNGISWSNLLSIMMDSCNIMRGSKSGLQKRIRDTVAPHLLDIDGDCAHHTHNRAGQFCNPFDEYLEGLCDAIYFDFKWSEDLREHLRYICLILSITYTIPEK